MILSYHDMLHRAKLIQRQLGSVACMFILVFVGCGPSCYLKKDETVNFYPGYAYKTTGGNSWKTVVRGQVIKPDSESVFYKTAIKALGAMMSVTPDSSTDPTLLQERLRPFTAEGRGSRAIPIEHGGKKEVLSKSAPSGYFEDTVNFPATDISSAGWLDFSTASCPKDSRRFNGRALAVPEEGISVISDVDDTLKVTHMANRQDLIKNTFMRDYKPVPGMAELYGSWHAKGAVFHYVSANPWQLYEPLNTFLKNEGYPEGTMHLKALAPDESSLSLSNALDVVASLSQSPSVYQTPIIEELLKQFPKRQFILIGNSGQKDPETYAALARRYPHQIHAIYIRQLSATEDPARWHDVFHGVPASEWKIFTNPSELGGLQ